MKILKDNKIRLFYIIISLFCIWLSFHFSDYFLNDGSNFNRISYAGTVITIIGLFITLSEVFHSLIITKSLQEQAASILSDFKEKEISIITHELDVMLEFIANDVNDGQYTVALRLFYTFNRTFNRVCKNYTQYNSTLLRKKLNSLEAQLLSFRNASIKSPVDNKSKTKALDNLMKIKQTINNQVLDDEGDTHATS